DDAQEALIIKRLVRDLALDKGIVVVPAVGEDSVLALSSWNAYLNSEEREAANVIHRSVMKAKEAYKAGERSAGKLVDLVRKTVEAEPRARIEYVNISNADNLDRLERI